MKYSGPQSDLQVLQNSELYTDFPVHMDAVSTYVPDETSVQHWLPAKIANTLRASSGRSYILMSDMLPLK